MTKIRGVYSPDNKRDALAAFDAEMKSIRQRMESGSIKAVVVVGLASEGASEAAFIATPNNFPHLVSASTAALRDAHLRLHPDCETCAAGFPFLGQPVTGPVNPRDLN